MLRNAGWAIGLVFVLAQAAAAQAPEQPEPGPLPKLPGPAMDSPAAAGAPTFADTPVRTSLFYVNADYLLWWVNHGPAPTLLTTAPNNGLNANGLTGGIIGQPGTQVLFDGHQVGYGSFSGLRGTVGVNLGDDGFWSFEVGAFYLPKRSIDYVKAGGPNGTPLLTVPFTDAATGLNQSLDISSQDKAGNPYLTGSIAIHSDLQLWGYEANMIAHSIRTPDRSVDLWVGFRSLQMIENLSIDQTIYPAALGNINFQYPTAGLGQANYFPTAPNAPVFVTDRFSTRNQFYGGQVGTRFSWFVIDRLYFDLTGKVALGVTHEQANISGSTTAAQVIDPITLAPKGTLTTPGGMFALLTNSGNFWQNQFSVVPELDLNLRYALTSRVNVRIGYSVLYWSNVARPGAQIDTVLNSKLIPTGSLLPTATTPPSTPGSFLPGSEQARPQFTFHDTAFWAQGINIGLEFRY